MHCPCNPIHWHGNMISDDFIGCRNFPYTKKVQISPAGMPTSPTLFWRKLNPPLKSMQFSSGTGMETHKGSPAPGQMTTSKVASFIQRYQNVNARSFTSRVKGPLPPLSQVPGQQWQQLRGLRGTRPWVAYWGDRGEFCSVGSCRMATGAGSRKPVGLYRHI